MDAQTRAATREAASALAASEARDELRAGEELASGARHTEAALQRATGQRPRRGGGKA